MAMTPSDRTEPNRLERDIVQRCSRGEVRAFEELYKRFGSRLYTVAYRMTGSAADAEDLVQDIFLQVYRRLGTFRGEAALGMIPVENSIAGSLCPPAARVAGGGANDAG